MDRKWYEFNLNKGQQAKNHESYTKYKWIVNKSETQKTITAFSIPADAKECNVVLTQDTVDFFQGILCPCEIGSPCCDDEPCVAKGKTAYSCVIYGCRPDDDRDVCNIVIDLA